MLENNGHPARGTDSPGGRLSRVSQAILRINESLVVDGASSLTGAPYAVIITLDDSGRVDDRPVLGFDLA